MSAVESPPPWMQSLCSVKMQFRTVLDVKVVDVEKRRSPSKHYVSFTSVNTAGALMSASLSLSVSVCNNESSVFLTLCGRDQLRVSGYRPKTHAHTQ